MTDKTDIQKLIIQQYEYDQTIQRAFEDVCLDYFNKQYTEDASLKRYNNGLLLKVGEESHQASFRHHPSLPVMIWQSSNKQSYLWHQSVNITSQDIREIQKLTYFCEHSTSNLITALTLSIIDENTENNTPQPWELAVMGDDALVWLSNHKNPHLRHLSNTPTKQLHKELQILRESNCPLIFLMNTPVRIKDTVKALVDNLVNEFIATKVTKKHLEKS